MGLIIFIVIMVYLLVGSILSGIIDDTRNESITDGLMENSNVGVPLCVLLWPVLIVLVLIITVLNMAYLLGKKAKRKWWNK